MQGSPTTPRARTSHQPKCPSTTTLKSGARTTSSRRRHPADPRPPHAARAPRHGASRLRHSRSGRWSALAAFLLGGGRSGSGEREARFTRVVISFRAPTTSPPSPPPPDVGTAPSRRRTSNPTSRRRRASDRPASAPSHSSKRRRRRGRRRRARFSSWAATAS